MLNVKRINERFLHDIMKYHEEHGSEGSTDEEIHKLISGLPAKNALRSWLIWNGIIGYTDDIWELVKQLRAAEDESGGRTPRFVLDKLDRDGVWKIHDRATLCKYEHPYTSEEHAIVACESMNNMNTDPAYWPCCKAAEL